MSSLAYSQWIRNQLLVPLNWIRHSAYSVGISTQAEAPPPVIVFPGPCWLCADRPDITCTHGQRWLPVEKLMKNSAAQKAFKIDLLLDLTESDDLTLQCLNNSFATLQISRKILRQKKVYHHVMWFTSAVNTQPLAHSVFSARVLDLVTSGLCLPWRDTGAGKNVLICQNYPNSPVDPGPARLILPPTGTLKHCLSALNIPDRPSPSRSTPRHTNRPSCTYSSSEI